MLFAGPYKVVEWVVEPYEASKGRNDTFVGRMYVALGTIYLAMHSRQLPLSARAHRMFANLRICSYLVAFIAVYCSPNAALYCQTQSQSPSTAVLTQGTATVSTTTHNPGTSGQPTAPAAAAAAASGAPISTSSATT